ncbi:MAG: tetratricopeptide repeat protein [Xanthomonadaceae bacterium]|nr:tetratricopeptide repeat protein [Xanthomonadaceae bacterium]MDE1884491.1 tetratricopeptide repeat protein [Xanthomonadaceae bacterium]MDE1960674.1 tetratricopeptide repeat protein [Xanthomonadaceae bacterium]MDE2083635.1 tetratricopeptide repeat protein [Xanthomonadaceae bacterium]MDE2257462.1 tetratricopeptide repeat protein [Xanthomonadaceae bacterium]
MAFDVLDEHEQGELVQKWLRENALSILIGVGLGLVLIFGWQQWRSHRNAHRLDAATQYQVFSDDLAKKDADGAKVIAAKLQSDYADTPYAVLAAMRLASDAAARGDNAVANKALQDAYEHAGIGALKTLAGLNLARSQIAQKKAQDALTLLDKLPEDGYAALRDELRGDALTALGRSADARKAYTDALTHLDANAANRAFVQMKLDNLPGAEKKSS